MSAKHGDPLRGLMSTARSPLFELDPENGTVG